MFTDLYLIYIISGIIILPCILLSVWASTKVHSAYAAFDKIPTSSDWTGSDAARMLLEKNGIYDINVVKGKGKLTDHFDPRKNIVSLSESTYNSNSVAAVAVAAHEIGHVVQKKKGYLFYNLRTLLVPITNFGSYLALPLVILGVILGLTMATSSAGNILVFVGVCLYGLSTLFTLVTLPVELNASRRAKKMLAETGVLQTEQEKKEPKKCFPPQQ